MYQRRSNVDAGERQFNLESEASGWRMHKFRELKVWKDMQSNKRTRDLSTNLENSTGEDEYQCITGWSRRKRWSIR